MASWNDEKKIGIDRNLCRAAYNRFLTLYSLLLQLDFGFHDSRTIQLENGVHSVGGLARIDFVVHGDDVLAQLEFPSQQFLTEFCKSRQ